MVFVLTSARVDGAAAPLLASPTRGEVNFTLRQHAATITAVTLPLVGRAREGVSSL